MYRRTENGELKVVTSDKGTDVFVEGQLKARLDRTKRY